MGDDDGTLLPSCGGPGGLCAVSNTPAVPGSALNQEEQGQNKKLRGKATWLFNVSTREMKVAWYKQPCRADPSDWLKAWHVWCGKHGFCCQAVLNGLLFFLCLLRGIPRLVRNHLSSMLVNGLGRECLSLWQREDYVLPTKLQACQQPLYSHKIGSSSSESLSYDRLACAAATWVPPPLP